MPSRPSLSQAMRLLLQADLPVRTGSSILADIAIYQRGMRCAGKVSPSVIAFFDGDAGYDIRGGSARARRWGWVGHVESAVADRVHPLIDPSEAPTGCILMTLVSPPEYGAGDHRDRAAVAVPDGLFVAKEAVDAAPCDSKRLIAYRDLVRSFIEKEIRCVEQRMAEMPLSARDASEA